ncbi:methyl-accepting chemotaxis protein [Noviherbaspirillum sp. UKPF54]|uniref:methyl-accepting chemotaxis protein n=1 Tax=Noviherbaspirillum sp. UKPF54 TaxID=2601898 RepID=UPI0011B19095|nr:methyl-accepting chemotaxis protein [Noviherbaspirillum sp. UKPF54]QDZ29979.1 hypothetical protein FAY22_19635 [Noviherbaspirillum sp. UKPF54]
METFARFSVATRLTIVMTIILALSFLATGMAILNLQQVAASTDTMMQEPLAKERHIADWYRVIHTAVRRTAAIAKSNDPSLAQFFAQDAAASTKYASEMQNKVEALLTSDKEKALFAAIADKRKEYIAAREAVVKAKAAGNAEEANRVLDTAFMPTAQAYQDLVQQLLDNQRKSIDATAAGVQAQYASSKRALIGIGIVSLLVAMACAAVLARSLLSQLGGEPQYAAEIARQIAAGDLAIAVETRPGDQSSLLHAMQHMHAELAAIVSQVRSGANAIAAASGQIASGTQDLSSRTEQQAASLEETASSMEQLTATVRQNADHARQANQLAVSASDVALRGGDVVAQVVRTMESIHASARQIVDIIGVIDGIAFQTNILALNAAVEAARAGEQGRGFAVVASDVRNLAQRSASAAKEIKSLIGASVEQAENGSALAGQAGATMREIVGSVHRVTEIMAEITSASQEQSTGIEQVNRAIAQMDQVTQQNAALVEETAAASEAMKGQAAALARKVDVFKLAEPAGGNVIALREPGMAAAGDAPRLTQAA